MGVFLTQVCVSICLHQSVYHPSVYLSVLPSIHPSNDPSHLSSICSFTFTSPVLLSSAELSEDVTLLVFNTDYPC